MLPDRVSNPGPLTYESGVLPIALRGPPIIYVRWGIFFDEVAAVFQIRRGNRDNLGIIIHISTSKTYFVTHH